MGLGVGLGLGVGVEVGVGVAVFMGETVGVGVLEITGVNSGLEVAIAGVRFLINPFFITVKDIKPIAMATNKIGIAVNPLFFTIHFNR